MPLETPPAAEVSPQAAYTAAANRALMTTNALILAEAQVIQLQEEKRLLRGELSICRTELEETKRLYQRRVETLTRRAEAAEGVTHDATADEVRADARCEAGPSHHFSD